MKDISTSMASQLPSDFFENGEVMRRLKIEGTYAHAVLLQGEDINQLRQERRLKFPENFNFSE